MHKQIMVSMRKKRFGNEIVSSREMRIFLHHWKRVRQGTTMALLRWLLAMVPAVFMCLAGCGERAGLNLRERATVQLKWVHQAQFAGFYAAQENGLYTRENLQVDFLEGGEEVDVVGSLLSGKAQFAVLSPEDVLVRRSAGAPLVAVAALFRRSAVVYAVKKGSGIGRLSDFRGRAAAVSGRKDSVCEFEYQFRALLKRAGLPESEVDFLPYDASYKEFIEGKADITAAYVTAGVVKLNREGFELDLFRPGDYGIRFYSDLLVTTEDMLERDPGLVERFSRATLEGWRIALADRDAALDAVMKYARIKDREYQSAMMEAQAPLIDTGEDRLGWMKEKDWQEMQAVLVEEGVLASPVDLSRAFTTAVLERISARGGR